MRTILLTRDRGFSGVVLAIKEWGAEKTKEKGNIKDNEP
jgi:hypothetical protein